MYCWEKKYFIFILPTYRPYVCLAFARETLIQVDVALYLHLT